VKTLKFAVLKLLSGQVISSSMPHTFPSFSEDVQVCRPQSTVWSGDEPISTSHVSISQWRRSSSQSSSYCSVKWPTHQCHTRFNLSVKTLKFTVLKLLSGPVTSPWVLHTFPSLSENAKVRSPQATVQSGDQSISTIHVSIHVKGLFSSSIQIHGKLLWYTIVAGSLMQLQCATVNTIYL